MDITTFSQTIEVFEKNIKNLIKYELIHIYHKISEKYKIPFDDLIKKCEYVYKDEYVSFPKMLDIRETARIEFRLSNAIHNTAIERLDIIKCNTQCNYTKYYHKLGRLGTERNKTEIYKSHKYLMM